MNPTQQRTHSLCCKAEQQFQANGSSQASFWDVALGRRAELPPGSQQPELRYNVVRHHQVLKWEPISSPRTVTAQPRDIHTERCTQEPGLTRPRTSQTQPWTTRGHALHNCHRSRMLSSCRLHLQQQLVAGIEG